MAHQLLVAIVAAFAAVSNAAPYVTSLVPVGDIAPIGLTEGYTQYYYQTINGSIVVDVVTGLFSSGSSTTTLSTALQIPPDEVMWGTPLAACSGTVTSGTNDVRPYAYIQHIFDYI